MRLLVVRHAVAVDREVFERSGEPDVLRPLTPSGIRKMRRAIVGLRALVPELHVLGASPLVRARQTAELLQASYGTREIAVVDALVPGRKPLELLRWLGTLEPEGDDCTVAVVGHEPHLGELLAFLLTGRRTPFVELRKGGAVLLQLGEELGPARARILWAAPPKILRWVGRGL